MNWFGTLFLLLPGLGLLVLALSRGRASRRNARQLCGRCGNRLPYEEQYRVEGRLVCPACAQQARKLIRGFTAVGGLVLALFHGLAITQTIRGWIAGQGLDLFPPAFALGLTAAGVWLWRSTLRDMRLENQRAALGPQYPQSLTHALRVREAVQASGVPSCKWMAGKHDEILNTPWWRSRRLYRALAAHEKTCETCLRSRAIADAALIMIPPPKP